MLLEIKVPQLAESVADATLMSWHRQPGEAVRKGEPLIDLETDKVTLEVVSPEDGVLKEILKQDGENATSQEVLATLETGAVAAQEGGTQPEAPAAAQAEAEPAPAAPPSPAAEPGPQGPAVRKLLAEHGLDASQVAASAPNGRLTKADVLAHLEQRPAPGEPAAPPPAPAAAAAPAPAPQPTAAGGRPEERVPMTRLRKRTAERLLAAQHQNAILSTFNEVNMAPVMALRKRYNEAFEKRHGVRLGFMSLFSRAVVEALKRFPIINAAIDGEDIVYHGYYDLGIAVSAPRGLVVPVIRDADQCSLADIETQLRELGEKARHGTLSLEDLTGGTFTITNGGVFGSLLSTPILNPPQSAILGMHKIQQRPVVEDGEVVARPMMYLALSYDHRIIDGRDAVQFLVTVKEQLEDPARMLLEI